MQHKVGWLFAGNKHTIFFESFGKKLSLLLTIRDSGKRGNKEVVTDDRQTDEHVGRDQDVHDHLKHSSISGLFGLLAGLGYCLCNFPATLIFEETSLMCHKRSHGLRKRINF